MAAAPSTFCDPCKNSEQEHVPVAICLECRELYCSVCLNCHKKMKATASHSYVYLTGEETGKPCRCDSCNDENKILSSLCSECRELYCTVCTNCHRNFKATKHHVMLDISCENSETNSTAITTDLASCSIDFDVTYSGAQVPVNETSQDKENPTIPTDKQDGDEATCVSLQTDPGKLTTLSATFHCKFSVATPSDKESVDINRMIALPDGRICVVDFNKKTIQLFSESYALCDEIGLKGCYALTCVDNDTVAILVSDHIISEGSDVIYFSVKGNKLQQTRTKAHIDGHVFDVAYRRGEFITRYQKENTDCTCYGNKVIVKQNRKMLLSDFMHFDPVSDCVLLGNMIEDTVTCYTMEGDVKWRSTLELGPKGIAVINGVVLVAVHAAHTIRQITMNGRLLPDPLLAKDQGITKPYTITYQPKQHRLLVTNSYDDNVMVFNLSQ